MNRRSLFRRLAAVAAVAPFVDAATAQATEVSERDQAMALVEDMRVNPGKYPAIEARIREIIGETRTSVRYQIRMMSEAERAQFSISGRTG